MPCKKEGYRNFDRKYVDNTGNQVMGNIKVKIRVKVKLKRKQKFDRRDVPYEGNYKSKIVFKKSIDKMYKTIMKIVQMVMYWKIKWSQTK